MRKTFFVFIAIEVCMIGCGTGVDIWNAVEKENIAAITLYVERGGDLNTGASLSKMTPLLYALQHQKKKSYKALLDAGANPNILLGSRASVMHRAAGESDSFWLERALAAKGDPNLINKDAWESTRRPVLWTAIMNMKPNNVALLLNAGADLNGFIEGQKTPVAYAFDQPDFNSALLLLQRGADYKKPARYGNSAIFLLRNKIKLAKIGEYSDEERKKLAEIVEWLKKDGFDPEKAVWDPQKLTWKQP